MSTPPPIPHETPRVFYALLREVHAAARFSAAVARVARRGDARRFVRGRCPTLRRFQSALAEALVARSVTATALRLPPDQAARLSRALVAGGVAEGSCAARAATVRERADSAGLAPEGVARVSGAPRAA